MSMVREKLKSRKGASIILALLVLLICITAGTAALTAASANAGRYTHLRADQQRYLAVASAAKLVRGELCGQSFEASVEIQENRTLPGEDADPQPFILKEPSVTCAGTFGVWLKDDLTTLFQATAVPQDWWDRAGRSQPAAGAVTYDGLGLEVQSDEELLSQVKWSLTLDDDYTLTAKFYLADEGARYYPMTLTIPATQTEELSEPQRDTSVVGQRWITTKKLTVTWQERDAVITQS